MDDEEEEFEDHVAHFHLKGGTTYCPPRYAVPMDEDDPRFIKSFHLHQTEEFKQFFKQFGFVVIRDVLSKEECDATEKDVWEYLESRCWDPSLQRLFPEMAKKLRIIRHDPHTWQNDAWAPMREEGILGGPLAFSKIAFNNRQNPNVHKAFAALFGREDLMVNHDRYILFRPTRGITFPPKQGQNAEPVKRDMPEWATTYNLHLDMNPWNFISDDASSQSEAAAVASLRYEDTMEFIEENNMVGVMADNQLSMQGIVNIVDNTSEDGGFQVVPGFSHHLVEWAKETEKNLRHMYHSDQTFLPLPKDEPMQSLAVHVTCRAGSLIIWDQRTAHGSRPNKSNKIRMAQAVKMLPAIPLDTERAQSRANVLQQKLKEAKFTEEELTELGEKLFGLRPWN